MDADEHPFADKRVRSLVGLSGGIVIAVVAFLYLEGIAQWIGYGIAVLDVVITPYILGKAVEMEEQ